jgi:protein-disulfide isomerase
MADSAPLSPPYVRGHDHAQGEQGPALVLFGDYEDPASAAAHRAITGLRERWDGFVYAWRHLPLGELHPNANGAALAAEGAAAQDAFWAFHHVLLARQDALSVPDLLTHAGRLGLDAELLMEDMLEGRHAERVLDDVRSAVASGARETPALFVAGERWTGGWEDEGLEGALRAAVAG